MSGILTNRVNSYNNIINNSPKNDAPNTHVINQNVNTEDNKNNNSGVNAHNNINNHQSHDNVNPVTSHINFELRRNTVQRDNVPLSTAQISQRSQIVNIRYINNPQSTQREMQLFEPKPVLGGAIGTCTVPGPTPTKGDVYFYANGIDTTRSEASDTANELSKLVGHNVTSIYNQTDGKFVDGQHAVGEMLVAPNTSRRQANETEIQYADSIYQALINGQKPKIIAHSEGAILIANSLQLVKDRLIANNQPAINMMKNVEVITLGGFANPGDFPKDIKLVQAADRRDLVPAAAANYLLRSDVTKPAEDYRVRNAAFGGNAAYYGSMGDTDGRVASGAVGAIVGGVSIIRGGQGIAPHAVKSYMSQPNVRELLRDFGTHDLGDIIRAHNN